MEREEIVMVIPSGARDLTPEAWSTQDGQRDQSGLCEILHFVQDDRVIGGVMHGVVLKWNEKK
jgi:hypothetical protein